MSDIDRLMVSVSGVRGVVGTTLTPEIACRFGCAFGTMLGKGKTVVIGRDSRMSGPAIRNAVAAGLLSGGVNVVDVGIATTPGTALMTKIRKADGGVIITASHNPKQYNGIKFLQPSGTGLKSADAMKLKEMWEKGEFSLADVDHQGVESFDGTVHEKHIEAVLKTCDADMIASKKFKVVVDSVNGAGCEVTAEFLKRLGCEVIHLNNIPDGQFAHPPEPVKENLTQLCAEVVKHGAAIGFAQDADADRLAIVDENGEFIGEEYTLALSAGYVLTNRKGDLATNLATSRMIDDLASAAGVKVFRAPTGEANVVEAMRQNGCIFGGEGGGGAIEPKVVEVRDSLVAIAYVLQFMAQSQKTPSRLVKDIPAYVMIKTKMPCPSGAAEKVAVAAKKHYSSRSGAKINDQDGLRIDLPEGWVLVRASNTEPIMRIMAEAPDEQAARMLIDEMRAVADKVYAENPAWVERA